MGGLSNEPVPDSHVAQTEVSQIGDHRLSTSCGIVERPNHHCGDDLVLHLLQKNNVIVTRGSWALTADLERLIQAFETKYYRRMLGVSYREHKTNTFGSRSVS